MTFERQLFLKGARYKSHRSTRHWIMDQLEQTSAPTTLNSLVIGVPVAAAPDLWGRDIGIRMAHLGTQEAPLSWGKGRTGKACLLLAGLCEPRAMRAIFKRIFRASLVAWALGCGARATGESAEGGGIQRLGEAGTTPSDSDAGDGGACDSCGESGNADARAVATGSCSPTPPQFFGSISASWSLALGPGEFGAVAVDSANNIIVGGGANGPVSIGTTTFDPSVGGIDGPFVVKLDPAGNVLWYSTFSGTGGIASVGIDKADDVYLAGWQGTDVATSYGLQNNLFVAKFDSAGHSLWKRSFTASGGALTLSVTLSVGDSGGFALAGEGPFGPAFGVTSADASADTAFAASFGPDGSLQYAKVFGAARVSGAVDPTGALLLAGTFNGALDLGNLTNAGWASFAAKLDPSGNLVWSEVTQGGGAAISSTPSGAVVAGFATGNIGALSSTPAPNNLFVGGVDTTGQPTFSTSIPAPPLAVTSMCADPSGGIAVTGSALGDVNFGGGLLQPVPGLDDAFVVKYNAAGRHVFSALFEGFSASSVAVDGAGGVVVGGTATPPVDLGSGPLGSAFTSSSVMTVVKLLQQPPSFPAPQCPPDIPFHANWPEAGTLIAAASDQFPVPHVVLSPTAVYWTTPYEVMSESFAVAQPTPVALTQDAVVDLAIDSHSLYWANASGDDNPTAPGWIVAAALDGGLPVTLATSPDTPHAIAVDDVAVYWTAGGSTILDGGTSQGLVLSVPLDGGAPTTLVSGLGQPGPIAASNGLVAFAAGVANTLQSQVSVVPRTGGPPSLLTTTSGPVLSIALDSATVYWSQSNSVLVDVAVANGSVQSVPLAGGSPTTLVGGLLSPGEIIVLGSTLYWSTGGSQIPPASPGGVWSMPTSGGANTTLLSNRPGLGNFAVDATHLAWIDIVDLASDTGGLFVMRR